MPRFNIDQRLQLARDICNSARAHDTLRRASQAVVEGLANAQFPPEGQLVFKKGALPTGYALCAYCTLKDAEVDALRLLQVAFTVHTDGVLRGRCELAIALFEGSTLLDSEAGKPLGTRLAYVSAFATPVELTFGDADHDVARLWQLVTKLGFGERFAWEPALAASVVVAFCDQVAP